jgi:hypothetical protein
MYRWDFELSREECTQVERDEAGPIDLEQYLAAFDGY